MDRANKALLVGISGVSSSGKTTLARLLRDIWPKTFIVHEDDFYWHDSQIPKRADGIQDWDCLEAINVPAFTKALEYIKDCGELPPNVISKEDQNKPGNLTIDSQLVLQWQRKARMLTEDGNATPSIAIVDGFLLYAQRMEQIWKLLDIRLFLRTSLQVAKTRREARPDYVTVEGFWKDPPGYVDDVVWPNYVEEHSFLFVNGDVEGMLDQQSCKRMNVQVMPTSMQDDINACLNWACQILERSVMAVQHPLH